MFNINVFNFDSFVNRKDISFNSFKENILFNRKLI